MSMVMETWVATAVALLSLAIAAFLITRKPRGRPPGPLAFPVLGNLIFLNSGLTHIQPIVNHLWSKYGPLVTIQLGVIPWIMVADRDIAHQMLVKHGSIFAHRPSSFFFHAMTDNHPTISNTNHGPLWSVLRRNLAVEMLSPDVLRRTADSRKWALQVLLQELQMVADSNDGVVHVREALKFAIFSLLLFLCFGERMTETKVREIQAIRAELVAQFLDIAILYHVPQFIQPLFKARQKRLQQTLQKQKDVLLPLISSRRLEREEKKNSGFCFLDSLLDLKLPEESKKKLSDEDILYLCGEFLEAGAETTSTALEWIMANLVKDHDMQERLFQEVGGNTEEEELSQKPYLKAVVREGLRRHPPGQFLITHVASEEMTMGGYTIPKGSMLNFGVCKFNLDEGACEEPMKFKPERFLEGGEGAGVDLMGRKKIEMLTFGAGRRVCPGMNLAVLELEYFVANLVGRFKWEALDEIDLSEKFVFTVVLKTPLRARISPR